MRSHFCVPSALGMNRQPSAPRPTVQSRFRPRATTTAVTSWHISNVHVMQSSTTTHSRFSRGNPKQRRSAAPLTEKFAVLDAVAGTLQADPDSFGFLSRYRVDTQYHPQAAHSCPKNIIPPSDLLAASIPRDQTKHRSTPSSRHVHAVISIPSVGRADTGVIRVSRNTRVSVSVDGSSAIWLIEHPKDPPVGRDSFAWARPVLPFFSGYGNLRCVVLLSLILKSGILLRGPISHRSSSGADNRFAHAHFSAVCQVSPKTGGRFFDIGNHLNWQDSTHLCATAIRTCHPSAWCSTSKPTKQLSRCPR